MKTDVEELSPTRVKLTIEVPFDELRPIIDRAYREVAKQVRVPGFRPGRVPFPLLHIDTGHNFPEVIAFRDARVRDLGERLIVRSVEDSMRRGTVRLRSETESRNAAQSVTLLEAIEEFGFDAAIGGARRDEEKARAKERVFSFRDEFGQWDPRHQRPELFTPARDPFAARSRIYKLPLAVVCDALKIAYATQGRGQYKDVFLMLQRLHGLLNFQVRIGERLGLPRVRPSLRALKSYWQSGAR